MARRGQPVVWLTLLVGVCLTLPPLTLTPSELEALNLGMAIVAEAADPELKAAAESLAAKVDAVLPVETVTEADAWKFAVYPFADAARGFTWMPTLRAAIKARQGVAMPVYEHVTVMDDQMAQVPMDGKTQGEIMFRGNGVMKGYLKNPEATAEAGQTLDGGFDYLKLERMAYYVHKDSYRKAVNAHIADLKQGV